VLPHNQSLVFGRYSREHLDLVAEEVIGPSLDEIVVDGVEFVFVVGEGEMVEPTTFLDDLSRFRMDQLEQLDRLVIFIVFASLNDDDLLVVGDHSSHEGRLRPQKDVIPRDDFGVYIGLSKGVDGLDGV
jgi:hypothetical protein